MAETRDWITLSDGTRLSATLYLPDDGRPAPVVLEALPYRKDDLTASYAAEYRRLRDEGGYAVCRLDLRGTGSSEGLAEDEYPPREQRDLCEVVDWLATREWSTGAVGMYGTSYSGFNSLQVAAERPPALKAIVSIYASDDRYADDVHYGGGVLRALDLIDYPLYMAAMNALPPVPGVAGPEWRDGWDERLRTLEPWLLRWMGEQRDGPYWRAASVRHDFGRIVCPTLIVAGWADGYHNIVFRALEGMEAPVRVLIGPWAHASPESALPGPNIDLVPVLVRWWDRWLRGVHEAAGPDPAVRVFVRRSTRLEPDLPQIRGGWRDEPVWPPPRARTERRGLATAARAMVAGLDAAAAQDDQGWLGLDVRGEVGVAGSIWCAGHLPFGQPWDQRPDEAHSMVFEWDAENGDFEILGRPRLEATVRSSAPVAFLSAKLCDVFPDGESVLVDRAVLNLTHRDGSAEPAALEPGCAYHVTVEMDATSWVFEPGHRVRLALAGSDWPNVWAPPGRSRLEVRPADSTLVLPVLPAAPEAPEPPLPAVARAHDDGSEPRPVTWRVEDDVLGRERRVVIDHGGRSTLEDGSTVEEHYWGHVAVSTADPAASRAEGGAAFELARPEATVRTEARMRLESDAGSYRLSLEVEAQEDGTPRWSRRFERTYPRDLQ